MNSKEALEKLLEMAIENGLWKSGLVEDIENIILQDLDRLENLEKCIDILKDNLFIYKKDNYRLSVKGSLEYQEVTNQEYELLKEVLENE